MALKKDITIRYHQTLTEIEDVRNSLKQIGNDEKWFEWIRIFGQQIQRDKDISEQSKKELLKLILDNIVVAYDHNEKVHRLTINFKIPVCINDVRESSDRKTHVVVKAPKSGRKSSDQNEPVSNYSTVIGSSTTPENDSLPQGYSLCLSVEFISANLWSPPYTPYQQELFDIITKYHEQDGWNFKQISDWLNQNKYLTPRGKVFKENHVWSIFMKKNKSITRFNREYDHVITDMKVDVVDYIPIPIV